MNRLANSRAYLIGAMDRAKDGGVGWRQYIQQSLQDLKINWLDPTNKPIDLGGEGAENRHRRHLAKQRGDYDYVTNEMKIIRGVDLRMVDIADWMVVNINLNVHATGTYEEVTLANNQKKPILICVEQGKQNTPDWLFGMVPHQLIFSTWEELQVYARHIATAPLEQVDHLKRWYFFNFMGDTHVDQG